VTRAIEARSLQRVAVRVRDEHESMLDDAAAICLELPLAVAARRRHATIHVADRPAPAVFAESVIVPERLPGWFDAVLRNSSQGLGQALAAGTLESRRELLWFGLGVREATPVLVRAYRVLLEGRPAMLIQEAFTVRRAAGSLELGPAFGTERVPAVQAEVLT
jgi:chorismate-pyruvate lyase